MGKMKSGPQFASQWRKKLLEGNIDCEILLSYHNLNC